MAKKITRREVMRIGGVAGAAAVAAGVTGYDYAKATNPAAFPWTYKKLNVKKIQKRGYENYAKKGKGCCYGVFEAVAGYIAEKNGTYDSFPWDMSTVGGGGIAGWGSTCGTANGAAWAIATVLSGAVRSQVINELYTWYETAKLPAYKPAKQLKSDKKVKACKALSISCHGSIENWVNASGEKKGSAEQKERCAQLVASVAGKVAEMLNDVRKGKFVPKNQMSKDAAGCLDCHDGSVTDSVLSKMACTSCHDDAHNQ